MAIHEIRVSNNLSERDVQGQNVLDGVRRTMDIPGLTGVSTARVFYLEGATEEGAKVLAENLFCESISGQHYDINPPSDQDIGKVLGVFGYDVDLQAFQPKVEIGYKPGVMNPGTASVMKAAGDLGVTLEAIDSTTEYIFEGRVSREEAAQITKELMNPTVERVVTDKPHTLQIEGQVGPVNIVPLLIATHEDLFELSKDKLFLNMEEMVLIKNYFLELGRNPTDCELEIIAARWSEHCGHKTFNARIMLEDKNGVREVEPLFPKIKRVAREQFGPEIVSAFDDNAGAIEFYDGMALVGKVETHNSPSAAEPYGGAATGSGGVFRDIMGTGQGANVIASTDMFCFAPPDLDKKTLPPGTLDPDYMLRRVVAGVADYGNRMGIPTNNGSVQYHPDFRAKPSVIVGSYGMMPIDRVAKGKPEVDDLIVVVGGRTGRDGIHGATFSSGEMTAKTSTIHSSAVQIGNAIEEKRMADALIEARDMNLIRAITDCGAAGFSSAIGEIGEDIGVVVDLGKAPTKYPGLAPWEIFLSESQERMVVAIAPDKREDFEKVCEKYNVESAVLGKFDGSNRLTVRHGDITVADLDYDFLKNGLPQREMKAKIVDRETNQPEIPTPTDWEKTFKAILSEWSVASKEAIVRKYDHGVQGTNALLPFGGVHHDGPNDAAILTPFLRKPHAAIFSNGSNPSMTKLNSYWGAVWSATEAAANYVAVGGRFDREHAALINNYIWPFPDEESMGSLVAGVDGVCDFMQELGVGVNSGKDSLSATYRYADGGVLKSPEVVKISVYGKVPDVTKTVSSDIKCTGTNLVLVGALDTENMGGTTYNIIHGVGDKGKVPRVDMKSTRQVFTRINKIIENGSVLSCHDVSEGGVMTTIAEMAFGGDVGVDVVFEETNKPENILFNQTAGSFIVELKDREDPKKLFQGLPFVVVGRTKHHKKISVTVGNREIMNADLEVLKDAWKRPLEQIFH